MCFFNGFQPSSALLPSQVPWMPLVTTTHQRGGSPEHQQHTIFVIVDNLSGVVLFGLTSILPLSRT
jgi:hypothetical protein